MTPVERAAGAIEVFDAVSDDGWCEWHHPAPGPTRSFRMKCCDCGLEHDVEFELVPNVDATPTQRWPGEGDVYVIWRLRRAMIDKALEEG